MFKTATAAARETIVADAELDAAYLLMNTLSAVIACYGLFANSPAVVIGAMIIATLVNPISAVALSLVDGDIRLLRTALVTLCAGIAVIMLTAFGLGFVQLDVPITHEIMSRTAPNLFDLIVALAGGAAGAYAAVSPRLLTAFIGVAIATALVPPLCAAGILLAHADYRLAGGAFSMAFANMVAIQFSASVVMWLTGVRRLRLFEKPQGGDFFKRNAVTISILIALALSFSANLKHVLVKQAYENKTSKILRRDLEEIKGSYLADVRFETEPNISIIRAVVRGAQQPTALQVRAIERDLPVPAGNAKNDLRIRFVKTVTINHDGLLYNDAAPSATINDAQP